MYLALYIYIYIYVCFAGAGGERPGLPRAHPEAPAARAGKTKGWAKLFHNMI